MPTKAVQIYDEYLIRLEKLARKKYFNPEINTIQAQVNYALGSGLDAMEAVQKQLDEQLNKQVTSDKVIKGVLDDIEVTE